MKVDGSIMSLLENLHENELFSGHDKKKFLSMKGSKFIKSFKFHQID